MNGGLVQWSDRMFGIVLFWFVKLLIIYRLLQQTSKIYGPSCTGQKHSTEKMVKFSFGRDWAKLFKPALAYKPSNENTGWILPSGFLSVLSLLIVTRASRAGLAVWRPGASSCDGPATDPPLVMWSSGYEGLFLNWSGLGTVFSSLDLSHADCLALKTMPRLNLTSEASAWWSHHGT